MQKDKINNGPKYDKSFTLKPSLTWHIRLHNRTKPYNCRFFNISFNEAVGLKEHEGRAHIGVLPFNVKIVIQNLSEKLH